MKGQHESCNENFYWTNADNGLLQIKQKHDKNKPRRKVKNTSFELLKYSKHLVK